jgi:uroporphyrinogen-III synthase
MSDPQTPIPRLNGLRVLVTRPKPMGAMLCELINSADGKAIYFPTINICPPRDESICQRQLLKINLFDWLIFISPQAVYSISRLYPDWPNFSASVKLAAVGGGTAKVLQAAGLHVDVFPKENWGSEGLLDCEEFRHIQGKKIALICGEGGRDWLQQSLKQRGATITRIIVYRRRKPELDTKPYCEMLENKLIDCIVATSAEGLQNLKELCHPAWQDLQQVPVIVVSQRLVTRATESGFKTILLAKNPGHNAIMDVLSANFLP